MRVIASLVFALILPALSFGKVQANRPGTTPPPNAGAANPQRKQPQSNQSGPGQNDQQGQKVKSLRKVVTLPDFCFAKTGDATFNLQNNSINCEDCKKGDAECAANKEKKKEEGIVYVFLTAGNADEIAKSFTDPNFTAEAVGSNKVAIYLGASSKLKDKAIDTGVASAETIIKALAKPPFQNADVVAVPYGTAAQLSQQLTALKISGLTASPIGNDSLLIKTDGTQGPVPMEYIKKRLFTLQWERPSVPPTQRLFEITTTDVMQGMASAKSGGDSGNSDKSTSSDKSGGSGTTPTMDVTVTAIGTQQNAKASADPASPAQNGNDPSTGADSKNSDTAKPPAAAKASSTDKNSAKDSTDPKPVTMQAVKDNLIYTNASGGDENIAARTRLVTMLDLPRPEVLMNLSTFQVSSNQPEVVAKSSEVLREVVARHNQLLQQGIEDGWEFLSRASTARDFFDRDFYDYVTQQFSINTTYPAGEAPGIHPKDLEANRLKWGRCLENQYCLGFAHAFEPPKPTFTNLLLTLAAAEGGQRAAEGMIYAMQKGCFYPLKDVKCKDAYESERTGLEMGKIPSIDRELGLTNYRPKNISEIGKCFCDIKKEILDNWPVAPFEENQARMREDRAHRVDDCETRDRLALAEQVVEEGSETLQLHCFAEQTKLSFADDQGQHFATRVGLLRAAIADFLFNYKMAQQYPHDFITYDLNQSAQELNNEFNPLILAFNRDVAALTQHLQSELDCRRSNMETGGWFGEKHNTFVNDGAIAVRGISGVESVVDTLTQNFFNATQPPSITDLVKSVGDSEKNIPDVLKANLTSHEAAVIVGALNSVKPLESKIGRQLKLDITPHALAGASSAELEVQLTNQESADPTLYGGEKGQEDNISRVARHNTTTRVRVESLKLFEVSSFSAMLQRPRSRFPIIPPIFEVPYFGSFLGLPLPGAKEYHRSTAIVSAIIVPTAADLAYGIDFSADRVCFNERGNPPVRRYGDANSPHCYRTKSFADLQGLPFRNYHKAMVQCFATGGISRYPGTNLHSLDKFKEDSEIFEKQAPNSSGDTGAAQIPSDQSLQTQSATVQEQTKQAKPTLVKPCSLTFSDVPPPE